MSAPTTPDARGSAAEAGLVSLGSLVSGIANLVLIASLTRLCDQPTFAVLGFVYLVQESINTLLPLGLPAALAVVIPKRGTEVARALGFWTGMFLLAMTVPVAAGLAVAGPQLASSGGIALALPYLALYLLGDIPSRALSATLLAKRSYRACFGVDVTFALSRFASLFVPALLGWSLRGMLTCFVGVAVVRGTFFLVYFLVLARGTLSRSEFRPKELLRLGVPLSLSLIVGKLNLQVDKYLAALLCPVEIFAVYTVGAVELPLVSTIAYSVTGALVPLLVLAFDRGDKEGFIGTWHGAMVKVGTIMMPAFFFFMVLAGPTMRVLFSAEYADAVVPFRVYLLLLPLRLCSYGGIARALGDTRPVLVAAAIAFLANITLLYPLFEVLGLAGLALAEVIGQVAAVLALLSHIRKKLGVGWSRTFPLRSLLRTVAVSAVASVPLLGILWWVQDDTTRLIAGAVVFVAGYVTLALFARVLTRDDFAYLASLARLKPATRDAS